MRQAGEEHEREHLSPRREKGKAHTQLPGPYIIQPFPFSLVPDATQVGAPPTMGATTPVSTTASTPILGPISMESLHFPLRIPRQDPLDPIPNLHNFYIRSLRSQVLPVAQVLVNVMLVLYQPALPALPNVSVARLVCLGPLL